MTDKEFLSFASEGNLIVAGSEAHRHMHSMSQRALRLTARINGNYTPGGGVIDPLPDDVPQFVKDYHAYYKTPRGYHKRSLNSNSGWNMTSALPFLNFKFFEYAGELENAVMIVHGDKAHSFYFGKDAFGLLKGDNKEFVAIPGASHTDLYDCKDVIPFDRIAGFFTSNFSK